MAGIIEVKDQGKVRIYDADNSNYVDIVVPSTVSSNRTITLPDASFTVPQADTDTVGLTGVSTDSGNVTITDGNLTFGGAGHGVHLGVTSAAASNLLDDYEEGTFTATMGTSSYHLNTGHYVKIGNIVQIQLDMHINTYSSGGRVVISGLPFAAKSINSGDGHHPIACTRFANTHVSVLALYPMVVSGNASIKCDGLTSAAQTVTGNLETFTSNTRINFSGSYMTA